MACPAYSTKSCLDGLKIEARLECPLSALRACEDVIGPLRTFNRLLQPKLGFLEAAIRGSCSELGWQRSAQRDRAVVDVVPDDVRSGDFVSVGCFNQTI